VAEETVAVAGAKSKTSLRKLATRPTMKHGGQADQTENARMHTEIGSVIICTNPRYPWFLQNGESEMDA
jgi:hypothetical protein